MNIDLNRDILSQIKEIVADTFKAVYKLIDPNKRINTFELLGYDFMIDANFKIYLIEVNTNPCLEVSSPLLRKIISSMIDNTLSIAVDPVFPPENFAVCKKGQIPDINLDNKFVLVFDEKLNN